MRLTLWLALQTSPPNCHNVPFCRFQQTTCRRISLLSARSREGKVPIYTLGRSLYENRVNNIVTIIMKISATFFFVLSGVSETAAFSTRPLLVTGRTNAPSGILQRFAQTEEKSGLFSDEVQQEAREVLEKVGWARPTDGEGELTSDDPFVQQINEGIQRDFGVNLDDLLNPAKVWKNEIWGTDKGLPGILTQVPVLVRILLL
jgi:hypothetical protein